MKCEHCQNGLARMRVNQVANGHQETRCLCRPCFDKFMTLIESNKPDTGGRNQDTGHTSTLSDVVSQPASSTTPLLDQYGCDLIAAAAGGKLEMAPGRRRELSRVITILGRRQKSNPLLIGEPGVGKTAVVEALARSIYEGSIPARLHGKRIVSLNVSSMIAGSTYRGQFEQRITSLLEELRRAPDVIVFIDELHTIIGAGVGSSSMDAAALLKPALARGELRCIGATTLEEYRKYIEKDAALERRFQPVMVNEPSTGEAIMMLQGVRATYEQYHGVHITEEAIEAAVKLSVRYITDRFLPDKAIDVMDEAASALHLQTGGQERIDEMPTGAPKLVVLPEHIAQVVENWKGVPVSQMLESERQNLRNLEANLRKRVIGQDEAIQVVARAIRRSHMGLKDPDRPIASFLFLGPTGVGKTELAKSLAAALFGDDERMIRLDMSEYMESHAVARLFGSPPGYIGYDEGGQLTEQVRRHPYSIVLLDEIEKAHPQVFDALLQVMGDGRLTDGKGRTVDFKNTVIVMTSNAGSEYLNSTLSIGFSARGSADRERDEQNKAMQARAVQALKQTFRPEFINRIDQVVVFHSLQKHELYRIIDVLLDKVRSRLSEQGIDLAISEEVRDFLLREGYDEQYGVRPLSRALQNYVDDTLADALLNDEITGGQKVLLALQDGAVALVTQEVMPVGL